MKYIILSVSLIMTLWLFACVSGEIADSKDVAQSEIYTKYYISMEEGEHNALVEAVFRFGGTKGTSLILTDPSYISINGKKMKGTERLFTGYYYSELLRQPDDYQYVFTFYDYTGKKYENTFSLYPAGIDKPSSISQTSPTEISVKGLPLQKNETFKLTIIDTSGTEKTIKVNKTGTQKIIVEPADVSELKQGPCKIYLTREIFLKPANCPQIGGIYEGTYKSKVRKSVIKK
ncbi:MAG TPA: hypothetical protein P5050_03540 [Bacteroidia bacterium]|nr:hypothetical protein [Bacteroidia bacterium]HRS58273.1 hypothetical protein [Bacteroidia bacterium]HRU67705.1 hypothetical protein [Bacteroidia bacterium]